MRQARTITRRNCLALGAGAAGLWCSGLAAAAHPIEAVVELFSSQGCRACPPGERLLSELRGMPGVLALGLHVDYWDYLGWKDTLASPEFSQRQYDYARARGDMDVFTPQMIVNGEKQMVGSQRSEVFTVLERSRRKSWPVTVSIAETERELVIALGPGGAPEDATLWVMPVTSHAKVKIERGEMAGHEIGYTNVVRRLVPAGMWTGSAARIVLPREGLMPPGASACVALLQKGHVGPILGCACWGSVTS